MKLIIGLGNPGEQYEQTRHNVGFMTVDRLLTQIVNVKSENDKTEFIKNTRHKALIAKTNEVILAKPQTFMNGSGEAVSSLSRFYRISLDQLYVIHDDLDIALGEYKIQFGKGPKIHNGINSVIAALGSDQFWRIRIGVEHRAIGEKIPGKNYLLTPFPADERELVVTIIDKVVREIMHVIR